MCITKIKKVLTSKKRGFNFVLTEMANCNISEVLCKFDHDDYIILADSNHYEGINLIWECKVNEEMVRKLFYSIWRLENFKRDYNFDPTWEKILPTVQVVLTETFNDLFIDNSFIINDDCFNKYYIDNDTYMVFAMIIDYSNFKKVYNQCYKKDNSK